jgi:DNA recombination protein RmuC
MTAAITAIVGVAIGAALVLAIFTLRRRSEAAATQQLLAQSDERRAQDVQAVVDRVRAIFGDLSRDALAASSEQFLRLANERLASQTKQGEAALDARKQLIDETVKQIAAKLTEVGITLQTLDKDRREAQGALLQRLDTTTRATAELQTTTSKLREALANPQRRGQWGERMAEDVLRLAGFEAGVNYHKQVPSTTGSRPDFTFPLPQGRCVNMDVKFPLANYLKCLDGVDGPARDQATAAFLRDVRLRIKEVTTREYIDAESHTVDYVLVFIPNEQVYAFIHEHDHDLLDYALSQKVVLCSPLTLYAFLVVIRQAAENLRIEQASREILVLLGTFQQEWDRYTAQFDKLGKYLDQAVEHFRTLTTTRQQKLDHQLDRIAALRSDPQLPLSPDPPQSREP